MIDYRRIAKMAARQIVAIKVAQVSADYVVEHHDADPDSMSVQVGSMVVGEVVAGFAKPTTDKMIDKAADFIAARRNKNDSAE